MWSANQLPCLVCGIGHHSLSKRFCLPAPYFLNICHFFREPVCALLHHCKDFQVHIRSGRTWRPLVLRQAVSGLVLTAMDDM